MKIFFCFCLSCFSSDAQTRNLRAEGGQIDGRAYFDICRFSDDLLTSGASLCEINFLTGALVTLNAVNHRLVL